VYIKEDGGDIFWSSDDVSYVNKITFPVSVQNTNTSAGVLTVIFKSDLTLSNVNQYFECTTSNIQFGSNTLNANGSRPIITIQVASYPGLIKNYDGSSSFNNITIKNIVVIGTGYSLATGAGWIGQESFASGATNNQIINCSSEGNIITNGGGIVGTSACSTANSDLTITNCTSKGTIANLGGGIIGGACSTDTNCTITISNCSSNGLILSGSGTNGGGGICGANCAANNGIINVDNSYSIGVISTNAGGIFGSKCGTNSGVTNATNCYSTGNIKIGGGIICANAGNSSGSVTATNCYSTGTIDSGSGGIFGTGPSSSCSAINCYTSGLSAQSSPSNGIFIGSVGTIISCYSEANDGGNSGSWSDAHANTVLQNVGTTWFSVNGINTAYLLYSILASPYTLNNIVSNTLVSSYTQTIQPGQSTIASVVTDYTFFQLVGSVNSAISIDSSTGVISTLSSLSPGTYSLRVYADATYSLTQFNLIISGTNQMSSTAAQIPPCCIPNVPSPNPQESDYDSSVIVQKKGGKAIDKSVDALYTGVATGQRTAYSQPVFKSYHDYIQYLQGKYR